PHMQLTLLILAVLSSPRLTADAFGDLLLVSATTRKSRDPSFHRNPRSATETRHRLVNELSLLSGARIDIHVSIARWTGHQVENVVNHDFRRKNRILAHCFVSRKIENTSMRSSHERERGFHCVAYSLSLRSPDNRP